MRTRQVLCHPALSSSPNHWTPDWCYFNIAVSAFSWLGHMSDAPGEAVGVRRSLQYPYPSSVSLGPAFKTVPCAASGLGLQPEYPAFSEVAQVLSTQSRLA